MLFLVSAKISPRLRLTSEELVIPCHIVKTTITDKKNGRAYSMSGHRFVLGQ